MENEAGWRRGADVVEAVEEAAVDEDAGYEDGEVEERGGCRGFEGCADGVGSVGIF